MANIESDLKSSFRKIEEKIEQRRADEAKIAEEGKKQSILKEKHTLRFDRKVPDSFVASLRAVTDKLKKTMHLESITVSSREVTVGGKTSPELTERQKETKEFIEWMSKLNGDKDTADICEGRFEELFARFRIEQAEAAVKANEASYKEFTIPEINKKVKMLDREQVDAARYFNEKDVSILLGPAGTGKTFLAAAFALNMLYSGKVKQIIIARPETAVNNKKKGFLPGDVTDKLRPLLGGFFDNFNELFKGNEAKFKNLFEGETDDKGREIPPKIMVQDIDYIRGRSINDAVLIIDESQNLLQEEIDVIKTRAGENTKLIFTGDISDNQTDIKKIFGANMPPFKHFVLKWAFHQNKIMTENCPEEVREALNMAGITQLSTVRRSRMVHNFIILDRFFENKAAMGLTTDNTSYERPSDDILNFEKKWIKKNKIEVKGQKPKPS